MTRRLQVLFSDEELTEIQRAARARHLTVAEYVRGTLRAAREDPATLAERKLAAVRRAMRHTYPTADIDDMLADIEAGYAGRGAIDAS